MYDPLIILGVTMTKTQILYYSDLMNTVNALCYTAVIKCSHLCTNSSAGEGLGGTAGGAFVISPWDGAGV